MDAANDNLVQSKTCTKCGELKELADFPKHRGHKDGHGSQCKVCKRKVNAEYRLKNPNKNKEDYHRRIAENPNYWAEYYARNRDKERKRVSDWQKKNPETRLATHRRFRAENPDYYRDYERKDPERTAAKRKRSYEKKMSTPRGKLENSVKVGVHRGLSKGVKAGRSTFALLGYSPDELKAHLKKQFTEGMSWDNYGDWHIDHIIPVSAFNYETPDDFDFKRCWALKNLQPMWAAENIRKHAKLDGPFQPSLAFAA